MLSFTTFIRVPEERVTNMLVTAFETNTSPWLGWTNPGPNLPEGPNWYAEPASLNLPGWGFTAVFDGPDDDEGSFASRKLVTKTEIVQALVLMHDKSPGAFAFLITENDDAETADIFMQYLLLGDVIYG